MAHIHSSRKCGGCDLLCGGGGRGVDGLGGALVVNLPRVDVEIALLYKSASTEWESSVYILFVMFNLLGHV